MARRTPFRARAAYRIRSGLRHLRRAIGEEANQLSRPLDLARSRALLLAALGAAVAALLAAGAAHAALGDARRHAVVTASHLHRLEAVDVPGKAVPGSTTTVWVGETGSPAAAPPSSADIAADATCVGLFTLGALSVLIASGLGIRLRTLDRRAAEAWARSWAEVEPTWTGRTFRRPRTDDSKQS